MQLALFDSSPELPDGFRYQEDFLPVEEEHHLLACLSNLDFRNFRWHEFTGKRRTVIFGWSYSFDTGQIARADPLPDFLLSARERAEVWAGLRSGELVQALATEYDVGAGIGWHRDAPPFGVVIGVSLLSACRFRLRLEKEKIERELLVQPRSIYALNGPARTVWQHGIPAAKEKRYSLTFRTLRGSGGG